MSGLKVERVQFYEYNTFNSDAVGGLEMNITKQFGVVYTPDRLANYVAKLLNEEATKDNYEINSVLDPACGEGALLDAAEKNIPSCKSFIGIDIDKNVINRLNENSRSHYRYIHSDAILPMCNKGNSGDYWKQELGAVSAVIANPPWSNIKQHSKEALDDAGYCLNNGQYDSYVLFIELAFKVLDEGGYFAFIIPDSLFDSQNEKLREYLTTNTQIRVIARLGEKIFEGISRATTVIVCKKIAPTTDNLTSCFRLTTDKRKIFLSSNIELTQIYKESKHFVYQNRFNSNAHYNFDIDTRQEEEFLLQKMKEDIISWDNTFIFGRGVEVSKKGEVVICLKCKSAQGYTKTQYENKEKKCVYCNNVFEINNSNNKNIIHDQFQLGRERIFVGEDVKRYSSVSNKYIETGIKGIDYKNIAIYNPPKILIRKTGLGIYAQIDYSSSFTSQTVYVLRYKNERIEDPLEFYLALLNSRVIYYFYLKKYGENEWKSHPYLTKKIIFSLPLKKYTRSDLDLNIVKLSKDLSIDYSYKKDLELEAPKDQLI